MQTRSVIIQGSSRVSGDTRFFADELSKLISCDLINLKSYNIGHFDYDHQNVADDFFPLISKMLDQYDNWIFASPIYWYSMSGLMKVFMDRISDLLLEPHKDLGRKLRGKNMAVLSVSNADDGPDSFYEAFIMSADYLGMNFLGKVHMYKSHNKKATELKDRLNKFSNLIS